MNSRGSISESIDERVEKTDTCYSKQLHTIDIILYETI